MCDTYYYIPGMGTEWPAMKTARLAQQPKRWRGFLFLYEFLVYIAVTITFMLSAFDDRNAETTFMMYKAVKTAFINDDFDNVKTRTQALRYVSDNVASVIFHDVLFKEGGIKKPSPSSSVLTSLTLISTARLRQLKVKPGCEQSKISRNLGTCFPAYSDTVLDKSPFIGAKTRTIYNFTESDSETDYLEGQLSGVQYSLGGHLYEFNLIPSVGAIGRASTNYTGFDTLGITQEVLRQNDLQMLLDDDWIQNSTRFLACEVSLMMNNGPRPVYGAAIVMFEFPISGGCLPTFQMVPFTPGEDTSPYHMAVMVLMSAVIINRLIMIVARALRKRPCAVCLMNKNRHALKDQRWYECSKCRYTFDRLTENRVCQECQCKVEHWLHTCGKGTFFTTWTYLLIAQFGLMMLTETLMSMVRTQLGVILDRFSTWVVAGSSGSPPYSNFVALQSLYIKAILFLSINVVLSTFGVFNYLRHFDIFGKYLRLFSTGAGLLLSFTLTFSIPFIGFSIAMHAVCGALTGGFQSIPYSIVQTFSMLKGDMQLKDMTSDNTILLILFYMIFGVMYIFIGLNVFISIVGQSYDAALKHSPDDVYYNSLMLLVTPAVEWITLRLKPGTVLIFPDEMAKSSSVEEQLPQQQLDRINSHREVEFADAITTAK
eukprot:PhF_6_TR43145/c0_g1_i2/m.66030